MSSFGEFEELLQLAEGATGQVQQSSGPPDTDAEYLSKTPSPTRGSPGIPPNPAPPPRKIDEPSETSGPPDTDFGYSPTPDTASSNLSSTSEIDRQKESLREILRSGRLLDSDKLATSIEVGRKLKIPASSVYDNFDAWQTRAAISNGSIEKFLDDPEMRKIVLENPNLAPIVTKVVGDGLWEQMLGWFDYYSHLATATQGIGMRAFEKQLQAKKEGKELSSKEATSAVAVDVMKEIQEYEKTTYPVARTEEQVDKSSLGGGSALLDIYRKAFVANDYAMEGHYALEKIMSGGDPSRHLLNAQKLELELAPAYYGESSIIDFNKDTSSAVASQVAVLQKAGLAAGTAYALATIGSGFVTKNPVASRALGREAASLVFKAELFYTTAQLESGVAFLDMVGKKTPDGSVMDPETAAGAAIIYGLTSAGVEVLSIGPLLNTLMPKAVREAVKKGGLAEYKRLMGQESVRRYFKEFFKSYVKNVPKAMLSEGSEEGIQAALQYASRVAGAAWQEGERTPEGLFKYFDAQEAYREAGQAFLPGALGGGFLGTGFSVVGAAGGAMAHQREIESAISGGRFVASVLKLTENEVLRKAPTFVVQMMKWHSQREGGLDFKNFWVKATEFVNTVGESNAESVATQLLGENGVQMLHDALKGSNNGFFMVTPEDFLTKWGVENAELTRQISRHVTTSPELSTWSEIAETLPKLEEEARKMADEAKKDPTNEAEIGLRKFKDQLREAFEKAAELRKQISKELPGTPTEVNQVAMAKKNLKDLDFRAIDDIVATVRKVIYTTAFRSGISPVELVKKYVPNVAIPTPEYLAKVNGMFTPENYAKDSAWDVQSSMEIVSPSEQTTQEEQTSVTPAIPPRGNVRAWVQVLSKAEQEATGKLTGMYLDPQLFRIPTILHEMGHIYLRMLKDISIDPNAPARLQADFILIQNWLEKTTPSGLPLAMRFQPGDPILVQNEKGVTIKARVITTKYIETVYAAKVPTVLASTSSGRIFGASESGDPVSVISKKTGEITEIKLQKIVSAPLGFYSRQQTETFAVSLEEYYAHGVAPSADLAPVFSRIRRWISRIMEFVSKRDHFPKWAHFYNKNPNEATPTANLMVKAVFDRLHATDAEIQRMTFWRSNRPLFRSLEEMKAFKPDAGPDDWKEYVALAASWYDTAVQKSERVAIGDAFKITADTWKEIFEKAHKEGWNLLKSGTDWPIYNLFVNGIITVDGKEVKTYKPPKMNRRAVRKYAPQNEWEALEPFVSDDGVDPITALSYAVQIVQMMAPESPSAQNLTPEAVLAALAVVGSDQYWENASKELIDFIVSTNYPGLKESQEEYRLALSDATRGSEDIKWLEGELKILSNPEAQGPGGAPSLVAKETARRLAEDTPISEIDVGALRAKERRAADSALYAAIRKDGAATFFYKQAQLLHAKMYDILRKAKEDSKHFKVFLKKMVSDERLRVIGHTSEAYLDLVLTIAEHLGAKKPTPQDPTRARAGVAEVILRIQGELSDVAFDPGILQSVLSQDRTIDTLTVKEMYEVFAALKQIWEFSRKDRRAQLDGKEQLISEVVARIDRDASVEPIHAIAPKKDYGWSSFRFGLYSMFSAINAARAEPEFILARLGETATRFFWDRYIASRNREAEISKRVLKKFSQLLELSPEMMKTRDQPIQADMLAWEFPTERNRRWLWMVMLNYGNQQNIDRLLAGRGWSEKDLLELFRVNKVTKAEWDFVQGVWDLMDDELWPEISETYRRHNGVAPEKVQAKKIVTEFGTYRGGYFPLRYVKEDTTELLRHVEWAENVRGLHTIYEQNYAYHMMTAGFTKHRSGEQFKGKIDLDFDVLSGHIVNAIHYISFDAMLRDSYKMINTEEFRDIVKLRLGPGYIQQLDSWLKVVATNNGENIDSALRGWKSLFSWSRGALMISTLGYNISVAAGDLVGPIYSAAIGRNNGGVGLHYIVGSYYRAAKSLGAIIEGKDFETIRQRAERLSKELTNRDERVRHQLNKTVKSLKYGARSMPKKMYDFIREHSFFFMEFTDKYVSTIVWDAAFNQHLDEQRAAGKEPSETEAARDADARVRKILPSHAVAEMPRFLSNRSFIGSLIAFFAFFNKIHLVNRSIWHRAYIDFSHLTDSEPENISFGSKAWNKAVKTGKLGKSATRAAAYTLASAVVFNVLGELLAGRGKEKDEEWDEWWARKLLAAPMTTVPFIGQVGEQYVNFKVTGKMRKTNIRVAPSLAIVERFMDTARKATSDEASSWEKFGHWVELMASAAQLPARQVAKTASYIDRYAAGEVDVRGPGDVIGGVLWGEFDTQASNPGRLVHDLNEF